MGTASLISGVEAKIPMTLPLLQQQKLIYKQSLYGEVPVLNKEPLSLEFSSENSCIFSHVLKGLLSCGKMLLCHIFSLVTK